MPDKATHELICKSLDSMKVEIEKRNLIYKHGVDLTNYENIYYEVSLNFLTHLLGGHEEEITWWLFDGSEKVYYHKDGRPDVNVEKSSDLVNYLLTKMGK